MSKHTIQVGDIALSLQCADALDRQGESALRSLQGLAGKGKGLTDGLRVRMGWSMFTLKKQGNELAVCEPDFAGNALQGVRPDVTLTLQVLALQASLLHKLRLRDRSTDTRFEDTLTCARGCLADDDLYLRRGKPTPGDSGWYLGSVRGAERGDDPSLFETLYVYQLVQKRKGLLQALLLPEDYMVVFQRDQVVSVFDPSNTEVWSGAAQG